MDHQQGMYDQNAYYGNQQGYYTQQAYYTQHGGQGDSSNGRGEGSNAQQSNDERMAAAQFQQQQMMGMGMPGMQGVPPGMQYGNMDGSMPQVQLCLKMRVSVARTRAFALVCHTFRPKFL